MNVSTVPAVAVAHDQIGPPESRKSNVIDLAQIKSILYLGLRGKVSSVSDGQHRVDTYA